MYCPKCGNAVSGQERFCRNCGQRLPETAMPQPPAGRKPVRKKSKAPWIVLGVVGGLLLAALILFAVLTFLDREEMAEAPEPEETAAVSEKPKAPEPSPVDLYFSYGIDDLSWSEALEAAADSGGRLAVFDSIESFEDLADLLTEKGLTGIRFWVGARRPLDIEAYYWVDAQRRPSVDSISDPDSWAYPLWHDGEPSFRSEEGIETCVVMYYDEDAGRWGLGDVHDSANDSAPGQFGYITMYDDADFPSSDSSAPAEAAAEAVPDASPAEPTPGETAPDYAGAYAAYLAELEGNREDIEAYTYGDQTALCDVYGDEVPELFYIASAPDDFGNRVFSDLHVCTYEGGALKTLCTETVHVAAGGGRDFCIFADSEAKSMALYTSSPSETQTVRQLLVFRNWSSPETAARKTIRLDSSGEETGTDYIAYGADSDEAGYENACRESLNGFSQTVLRNYREYGAPAPVAEHAATCPYVGQPYADLISYLQGELPATEAPAQTLPAAADGSLSEAEMYDLADGYGHVGIWCWSDYDGDGRKEAYALITGGSTGDPNEIDSVLFVDSAGNVTLMASDFTGAYYDREDGYYMDYHETGFFHVDYGAYGSGYSTMLFSVRDGKPYELDLSRHLQGFFIENGVLVTTGNDFSQGSHQYPRYVLVYDPDTQQFQIGDKVAE